MLCAFESTTNSFEKKEEKEHSNTIKKKKKRKKILKATKKGNIFVNKKIKRGNVKFFFGHRFGYITPLDILKCHILRK